MDAETSFTNAIEAADSLYPIVSICGAYKVSDCCLTDVKTVLMANVQKYNARRPSLTLAKLPDVLLAHCISFIGTLDNIGNASSTCRTLQGAVISHPQIFSEGIIAFPACCHLDGFDQDGDKLRVAHFENRLNMMVVMKSCCLGRRRRGKTTQISQTYFSQFQHSVTPYFRDVTGYTRFPLIKSFIVNSLTLQSSAYPAHFFSLKSTEDPLALATEFYMSLDGLHTTTFVVENTSPNTDELMMLERSASRMKDSFRIHVVCDEDTQARDILSTLQQADLLSRVTSVWIRDLRSADLHKTLGVSRVSRFRASLSWYLIPPPEIHCRIPHQIRILHLEVDDPQFLRGIDFRACPKMKHITIDVNLQSSFRIVSALKTVRQWVQEQLESIETVTLKFPHEIHWNADHEIDESIDMNSVHSKSQNFKGVMLGFDRTGDLTSKIVDGREIRPPEIGTMKYEFCDIGVDLPEGVLNVIEWCQEVVAFRPVHVGARNGVVRPESDDVQRAMNGAAALSW